jgi:uncharacterized protein with HEPN domain
MSPDADRVRLRHMLDAARQALAFVDGRTRADLDHDPMLLLALTRAVEIVGEAAGRVSDEGRRACPGVQWPEMTGMRNRLVHAYFDVDHDVLWTTVVDQLPGLCTELERALAGE